VSDPLADLDAALAAIRSDYNREPKLACGHSLRSLVKISGVGELCMECDTTWERVPDPVGGPLSLFRKRAAQ
jgi:hypothetical protein